MTDCCMTFSDDWREFLKEYSFKDEDEVYTNGSQLIQVFRVEQLIEHLIALKLLKEQEPVRCKDCKNAEPAFDGKISRCKIRGLRQNDWFCADGERR